MKFIVLLAFLVSCTAQDKLVTVEGETMGTYYRIKGLTSKDPQELKKKVDKFLVLFNDIFSTYIDSSEINKVNKDKLNKIKVSKSFERMLILSQEIYKKSEGYFDITVSPLVDLWGFGPDGKRKKPSQAEIESAKKNIGGGLYKIDDRYLEKLKPITLDMSAIAKGFGVDELMKFLEFQGLRNFLVEIGGEVRAQGFKDPKNKTPWVIGIEGPSESLGRKIIKAVKLNSMAMATSGSYRNYIKYGDEVFNHTINPKTGYPVNHQTISVSVLEEYCADADAWATALMSMGVEKGLEIAKRYGLKVLFQFKENNEVKVKMTEELKSFLENK